jgi:hypothetical protein
MFSFVSLFPALFLLWGASPAIAFDEGSDVYNKLLPKTVGILALDTLSQETLGTGFVLAQDATSYYVVTNHHVVKHTETPYPDSFLGEVDVFHPRWENGKLITDLARYRQPGWTVNGRVLGSSVEKDIALIQIAGKPPEGIFAEEGELPSKGNRFFMPTAEASPGERVFSIGNSTQVGGALFGYASGEVRQKTEVGYDAVSAQMILTSLPINPGDSGGPVVNLKGEIVGINSAFAPDSRSVSHSISLKEVKPLLGAWLYSQSLETLTVAQWERDVRKHQVDLSMAELVTYYQKRIGFFGYAQLVAERMGKLMAQQDDQKAGRNNGRENAELWLEKSDTLLDQVAFTAHAKYVAFHNKCRDTPIRFWFRYETSFSGKLDELEWLPKDPKQGFTVDLEPGERAYIRVRGEAQKGKPIPVRSFIVQPKALKGKTKWPRTERIQIGEGLEWAGYKTLPWHAVCER